VSRYRWVILAVGTLAQATYSAVLVGLPAIAPFLRSHYRLTLGQTGVVLAAAALGSVPTVLPWGFFADRFGERAALLLGLAGSGASLFATGWTHTYGSLVVLLVLGGAFGASVSAASGRAVMAWFPQAERGLALGIRQCATPIGGAYAALVLPSLAATGGTKLAFAGLGGLCVVGAVAAAIWLRDPAVPEAAGPAVATPPLRDVRMWLLASAGGLYVAGQMAVMSFLVLFLHEHRGVSARSAAVVLGVVNVLGGVARISAGRWSDRIGSRLAPLRMLGLLISVGLVVVAVAVDAPLAVVLPAIVVAGVLGLSWNGLSFTAAAETAGLGRSGAAIGFQQTALAFGGVVVPIAFAATVDASSWRIAFLAAACFPLLGVVLLRRVPEAIRQPD
jgi:MFS family permease